MKTRLLALFTICIFLAGIMACATVPKPIERDKTLRLVFASAKAGMIAVGEYADPEAKKAVHAAIMAIDLKTLSALKTWENLKKAIKVDPEIAVDMDVALAFVEAYFGTPGENLTPWQKKLIRAFVKGARAGDC